MRRLADFQNRVFRNYSAERELEFVDVAKQFPRDPNLVWDAIHNTPAGVRVRSWIILQELVPILRDRIEQGILPRPDRERLTDHPAFGEPRFQTTTWRRLQRACT